MGELSPYNMTKGQLIELVGQTRDDRDFWRRRCERTVEQIDRGDIKFASATSRRVARMGLSGVAEPANAHREGAPDRG
jgi:hypothetical protein